MESREASYGGHIEATSGEKACVGKGKKAFRRAQNRARKDGTTIYRGQTMTFKALGGHLLPDCPFETAPRSQPRRPGAAHTSYGVLSWNAGGLTSAVWEELMARMRTEEYKHVSVILLQETHWRGSSQFETAEWVVVGTGTTGDRAAGVAVLVRRALAPASLIRFHEVVPGRLLHVRIPLAHNSLDVVCVYQHVWRGTQSSLENTQTRADLLHKLRNCLHALPKRNLLVVAGDFNMSLKSDYQLVGPCTQETEATGHRDSATLQAMLEELQLSAINTWAAHPVTFRNGCTASQIDYMLMRKEQAKGPAKMAKPDPQLHIASWRYGGAHLPLRTSIQLERHRTPPTQPRFNQKLLDAAVREQNAVTQEASQRVDQLLPELRTDPMHVWEDLNNALTQVATEYFPTKPQRSSPTQYLDSNEWDKRRVVASLPGQLKVLSHRHEKLRMILLLRVWRIIAQTHKKAKNLSKKKRQQKRANLETALADNHADRHKDGGHRYHQVIKQFKAWRPNPRVHLRSADGEILAPKLERELLRSYSEELFSKGDNFPINEERARFPVHADEVAQHLKSIKIGKAVPKGCAPISMWRLSSPSVHEHLAGALQQAAEGGPLHSHLTDAHVAWLPKPGKPPSHPKNLRPIGIISPEGKVLAAIARTRLLPTLLDSLHEVPQFGFVPGRGTEEAIAKALSHMSKGREINRSTRRQPGRGSLGIHCAGALTLSVDLSKAFDTVNRAKLFEALETAQADPDLVKVIGKLHIDAAYRMVLGEESFSVPTKRGIKQGCKLAPSLYSLLTGFIFKSMKGQHTLQQLREIVTMYADDTLAQFTFLNEAGLQTALSTCEALLDTLSQFGFAVNPDKSSILLTVHGGSASTVLQRYTVKTANGRQAQLPAGARIPIHKEVGYLGVTLSYTNFEDQTLKRRLQASKAAFREVKSAVQCHRAVPLKDRIQLWKATAWASATYGLHVTGLTAAGAEKLHSAYLYQLRRVARSYSHDTHETNTALLGRLGLPPPLHEIIRRTEAFLCKHSGKDNALQDTYLDRVSEVSISLQAIELTEPPEESPPISCATCGRAFKNMSALRKHVHRQHPPQEGALRGPSFNPAVHAQEGHSRCAACKRPFRSFISLRKHVEASSCPQLEELHRLAQVNQDIEEDQAAAKDQPRVMDLASKDPETLALRTDWHPSSRCCLCGQRVGGNKAVKQHLNKQHPELMSNIRASLQDKLRGFKHMLEKNTACRYCGTKVDAPTRHAEQCVSLLQAHVLNEISLNPSLPVSAVRKSASFHPAKDKEKTASKGQSSSSGDRSEHQHLPMRNPGNQCYAIAVHQALHRSTPHGLSPAQGRALSAAKFNRLAPSDAIFRGCTGAWTLDGTQQDAAEFLTHLMRVASQDDIQWEARLQQEGRVSLEDLGISPITLPYQGSAGIQTIVDSWSNQPIPHALSKSSDLIILQLPRFVDGRKVHDSMPLQEEVHLPQFEADGIQVHPVRYHLVSFIAHIGHTPHSGHYRTAVRTAEGWRLGDDDKATEPVSLSDPLPLNSAYLAFLVKELTQSQP